MASQGDEATPEETHTTLSDAQITQILATVDSGEIEQAQLAAAKATDPRVREFAQNMIDQHTQSKLEGQQLAAQNNLTPTPSPMATQLQSKANQTLEQLKAADASSFDQMYMRAQIKQHQAVLNALSDQLQPAASSPALKQMLSKARSMVQHHLDQAQQIAL
jgi:putative membrane protein